MALRRTVKWDRFRQDRAARLLSFRRDFVEPGRQRPDHVRVLLQRHRRTFDNGPMEATHHCVDACDDELAKRYRQRGFAAPCASASVTDDSFHAVCSDATLVIK
jgi:hypothetical protein